jgi:hypothetical protein
MRWLADNFTVTTNPAVSFTDSEPQNGDWGRTWYYLYGLERVGALKHTTHIGEHDWYKEGATWLVDDQKGNGLWQDNQPDTCFSLLFLARATSRIRYTGAGSEASTRTYGGDDPLDDVSLRAAGSGPLTVWISSFGKRALEDFCWEADSEAGLRVVRVEYRSEDPGAEKGSILLSTIAGDPTQPSRASRFAARLEIERAGIHRVFARVFVQPPEVDDGSSEDFYELESRVLEVEINRADDPRLDEYARDSGRNLLNIPRVEITASTEREGDYQAERAIDGLIGTRWMSADDDPLPHLEIELPRAVRGKTLLFTHATDQPGGDPSGRGGDPARTARIRRIAVSVNGGKTVFEAEMNQDERVKTVVEFPKATKVRSLRIEVLEVFPSAGERDGVGFAEIELVDGRKKKR